MGIDQYSRDGTDLFQIPSIGRKAHFVALLGVNNESGSGPSDVCGCDGGVYDLSLWKLMKRIGISTQ